MISFHPLNRCYAFYFINKETKIWGISNMLKLDNKVIALALKPDVMLFNILVASEHFHIGGGCLMLSTEKQTTWQIQLFNIKCYFYKCISNLLSYRDRLIQKQISKFQHMKQTHLNNIQRNFSPSLSWRI